MTEYLSNQGYKIEQTTMKVPHDSDPSIIVGWVKYKQVTPAGLHSINNEMFIDEYIEVKKAFNNLVIPKFKRLILG